MSVRFDSGRASVEVNTGRPRFSHPMPSGPLSYIGGKRALAKRIIAMFSEHTTYVEAFSGGAQVLFHKEPSKVEVINDLDGELVNFFRVCQHHHEELIRQFRFSLVSRKLFSIQMATDPATLTDIQRAARYFYLQKNAYAGLVRRKSYNYSVVQKPGFNLESLPELLENAHKRLARVQVECLPYEEVLARYDRPTTLFYLDPPYYGLALYRFNLNDEDFAQMAARLGQLRGKFVLSLNDVPEVRRIFRPFHIQSVALPYTAQKTAGRRFHEVLITNH